MDKNMINEYTGMCIAEQRAILKYTKDVKNSEVLPALKALQHLYGTMQHSTKFNHESYEAKRLIKEIKNKELELASITADIEMLEENLSMYTKQKDEFYQAVRRNRKGQN